MSALETPVIMSLSRLFKQAERADLTALARQSVVTLVIVAILAVVVPWGTAQIANNVARKSAQFWVEMLEPAITRKVLQARSTFSQQTRGSGASTVTLLDLMVELQVFRLLVFEPEGDLILSEWYGPGNRDYLISRQMTDAGGAGLPNLKVILHEGHGDKALPLSFVELRHTITDRTGAPIAVVEFFADASDELIPVRVSLRPLNWAVPVVAGLSLLSAVLAQFASTVGARARLRQMQEVQRVDPMTGLPNRKGIREDLELLFVQRNQTKVEIAFILVDIDSFASINETAGPEVADELLSYLADGLRTRIGPRDRIGRIGGDQFLIAAVGRSPEAIEELACAIDVFVRQPFPASPTESVNMTASIGIAYADLKQHGMKTFNQVNLAMLEVKRQGGNGILFYSPDLEEQDIRRRRLLELLRNPWETGVIKMVYQPIVSCADGSLRGFEALMRCEAPDGEKISPAEFIPIAEESGLSSDLGFFALQEAAKESHNLPPGCFIAVNLSVTQFASGNLPDMVADILDTEGAKTDSLQLEVTESLLIEEDDAGSVARQLAELRALGLRISIDDFGTGYSSLGYLWKYTFDKLKIDRAFVEGYDFDRSKHRQIIETIVILGKNLGLTIILEGIETELHAALAREIGCDQAQGYYYGKPMPIDEALTIFGHGPDDGQTLRAVT